MRDEQLNSTLQEARQAFYEGKLDDAFRLYVLCADAEHADAQVFLGWLYESGKGTPTNIGKAIHYYTRAAEAGNAEASLRLGDYCERTGKYAEAVQWYRRAAEMNHMAAAYRLACMIRYGTDVIDINDSLRWLERAANMGHIWARAMVARQMLKRRIKGGAIRAIALFIGAAFAGVMIILRSPRHSTDPRLEK